MMIRRRIKLPGIKTKIYKTKSGIWLPEYDVLQDKRLNVIAVLRNDDDEGVLIPAYNIVTNTGDTHYAQRACSETLTNAYGIHEMATAAATGHPAKGSNRSNFTNVSASQKATSTGYPQSNDGDSDNTGAGVDIVTHRVSYTQGDFNQTGITHGIITNTTPATAESILTGYAFAASFDKTASDTLKVFVNHEMSGQ